MSFQRWFRARACPPPPSPPTDSTNPLIPSRHFLCGAHAWMAAERRLRRITCFAVWTFFAVAAAITHFACQLLAISAAAAFSSNKFIAMLRAPSHVVTVFPNCPLKSPRLMKLALKEVQRRREVCTYKTFFYSGNGQEGVISEKFTLLFLENCTSSYASSSLQLEV